MPVFVLFPAVIILINLMFIHRLVQYILQQGLMNMHKLLFAIVWHLLYVIFAFIYEKNTIFVEVNNNDVSFSFSDDSI